MFFSADLDIDGTLTNTEYPLIEAALGRQFKLGSFDVVDSDGSGGIDINELLYAFGVS